MALREREERAAREQPRAPPPFRKWRIHMQSKAELSSKRRPGRMSYSPFSVICRLACSKRQARVPEKTGKHRACCGVMWQAESPAGSVLIQRSSTYLAGFGFPVGMCFFPCFGTWPEMRSLISNGKRKQTIILRLDVIFHTAWIGLIHVMSCFSIGI